MRSTFLGNFLGNIHERFGHKVTRINYLGDWGTQYGLLAVGFKKYGSYEKLTKSPIKHLLGIYLYHYYLLSKCHIVASGHSL